MKQAIPFHRQFELDFSGHSKERIQRRMDRIVRAINIWYTRAENAPANFDAQNDRYFSLVRRSELTFVRLCAFD